MELDDFLLEDYKLKIAYLTNHFDRMWNRFNFFVGIETATRLARSVHQYNEVGRHRPPRRLNGLVAYHFCLVAAIRILLVHASSTASWPKDGICPTTASGRRSAWHHPVMGAAPG